MLHILYYYHYAFGITGHPNIVEKFKWLPISVFIANKQKRKENSGSTLIGIKHHKKKQLF